MKGTASIGECMLELSGTGTGDWKLNHAGDTFNVMWALRALLPEEQATDYVSAFGDDPFSQQQLDFFAQNGIRTAASPRIPGARPGLYAITLTGAERSFTYWRADSAARKLADEPGLLKKSLENKALIYFSGITLAILEPGARENLFAAITGARAAGSLVAFDPNYRPRLWPSLEEAREAISTASKLADICLPTFPDEQALFGDANLEATANRLASLGVKEIVVKNGEEPALVVADGTRQTVAAQHVINPVDTTGAGDSFNGGYLAARLQGKDPVEAARHGHRVAAAVVQVRGALAPFETLRAAFAG
ncbi:MULTISPECIES: sugar kinase [unclassified Aminobacter]|uniref:sugar kinase n=1 Tax=unclassified Aminobacter TaxID=2644704 RepID=UPI0004669D59|nr:MULTISPECIES: sugar kinase [unclassified Aminobacter]TWH33690.1 2-keto-3-deoxygluconate kinase [Aminobacter sp. J15]